MRGDSRSRSFSVQGIAIAVHRGNGASIVDTFAPGLARGGLYNDTVLFRMNKSIGFKINNIKIHLNKAKRQIKLNEGNSNNMEKFNQNKIHIHVVEKKNRFQTVCIKAK